MKFNEYITTNHVFTTDDLISKADSEGSAKMQLRRALESGAVERVRRGLYVSHAGRFEGSQLDPYEVVIAADKGAVLSYHSALEALGVAHNVGFECRFRTDKIKSPFEFGGIRYFPHAYQDDVLTQRVRGKAYGSVFCTTREQTIMDCLKHPEFSGGIEEVMRSLSAFPYVDTELVVKLALKDNASMSARLGWLLDAKSEQWRVSDNLLDQLLERSKGVTAKLDKRSSASRGWSRKWNLTLPEPNEEVESWIR